MDGNGIIVAPHQLAERTALRSFRRLNIAGVPTQ
jgi:hypothetical protein